MSNKKYFIIGLSVIAIFLVLFLTAKKADIRPAQEDKITALSTFTVISDMVREVGGDKVEAVSLTKPGTEIHGYEPTPGDLVRASKADIIFDNGLGLEAWAEKLYTSIPSVKHVTLSEGVEPIPIKEGLYKDRSNPHVWMSPKQALVYVENIRRALSEISPENAEYFKSRAEEYSARISALDGVLSEALRSVPEEKRTLVSCEGAFSYLASDYGMKELYLWAINDESQGSPQQIAKVVDEVKKNDLPVVFCESTIEPKIQQEVALASGAKLGGLLYVDSLSSESGPASTYLKMLEYNVNTIVEGMTNPN